RTPLIPPPPPSTLLPYTTLFRSLPQETREQELVDRGRERRRRRVDRGGIAAQRDRDRHPLAPRRHGAPVRRAHLVALPVHRQLRSEEHTSELQSRGHLVCRLLLE